MKVFLVPPTYLDPVETNVFVGWRTEDGYGASIAVPERWLPEFMDKLNILYQKHVEGNLAMTEKYGVGQDAASQACIRSVDEDKSIPPQVDEESMTSQVDQGTSIPGKVDNAGVTR